jgi:hypothetical protein
VKLFLRFGAPLVLVFAVLSQQAVAGFVVGEISFNGSYTTDNPNLALATRFTSFNSVVVSTGPTGDYAGLGGAAVTQNPFTIAPFPAGGVVPLWSIAGPSGASFDLLSLNIEFESPTALILRGLGTARLTGKDPTPGTWTMSANTLGTTFSFSSTNASTSNLIPEPSTALTGLALAGVCAASRRRRFSARV